MARLVVHERNRPYVIDASSGESFMVCGCGLSKNKPLCDGSHKCTAGEEAGAVYLYDEVSRVKLLQNNPSPASQSSIVLPNLIDCER